MLHREDPTEGSQRSEYHFSDRAVPLRGHDEVADRIGHGCIAEHHVWPGQVQDSGVSDLGPCDLGPLGVEEDQDERAVVVAGFDN